ncbi:hypothetical protein PRZ48_009939 [Zasmidium cellare]|uniref:Uncharacterized protein n=1 Tax=Zasmidium cellare TaxID=395010 RepID=A0ABR0EE54_ZASCE|nr:hypothetical protein PRZ48_009939 [Zasmidium cellare]
MALHKDFNTLPTLGDAHNMFKDRNAETYLYGPIRDVFLKHNMEDRYGISLLHRHFSMGPNERLVEYGAVSTPWTLDETDDHEIEAMGGYVVPQNYRLDSDDDLLPFEYEMQYERPSGGNGIPPEFLYDLKQTLKKYNLSNVFGLRKRGPPTDLTLEVTNGRANIMIKPMELAGGLQTVEAFWTFGSGEPKKLQCAVLCVYCPLTHAHFYQHQSPL